MKVLFHSQAYQELIQWASENKKTFDKINKLIKEITRDPFEGISKPERLKHNLSGYLSRRIDKKNRLVYRLFDDDTIEIKCRSDVLIARKSSIWSGRYGDRPYDYLFAVDS